MLPVLPVPLYRYIFHTFPNVRFSIVDTLVSLAAFAHRWPLSQYLSVLRFADIITLLSNSGDELQSMVTDPNRQSRTVGLKINMQKTENVQ